MIRGPTSKPALLAVHELMRGLAGSKNHRGGENEREEELHVVCCPTIYNMDRPKRPVQTADAEQGSVTILWNPRLADRRADKSNEQECGMKVIRKWGAFGLILAAVSAGALFSQSSGLQIKRTVVHRADVSVPGREAVIARGELAA